MRCQTEEDCSQLVRLLPPTEVSLLDWAINLMADVVEQEHLNKMNARNIAMVFAPNMTQVCFYSFSVLAFFSFPLKSASSIPISVASIVTISSERSHVNFLITQSLI